jgi:AcrR family transcriptional regulator
LATRISRPPSAMRKGPRQARSRATIDAILDASARILGERGWLGLTTNDVAEAAGVSIGSLYQYFPNKLALIEAVRRRHFEDVLAVLRAASDETTPRKRRITALVDGMIAIHGRSPAAHRVLLEESPRGEDTRGVHDGFVEACRGGYEAVFKANAHGVGESVPVSAQVLAGAVAGAVHEAARRETLTSPSFRREFVTLVVSFLSKRRETGSR